MPISSLRSAGIILLVAAATFLTRLIPFILFPKDKEIRPAVKYLGGVLPPAVIGMLVIYCFKSLNVLESPFGIPEFIAGLTVAVLHVWRRNNLLSIGAGTILYMMLVQHL